MDLTTKSSGNGYEQGNKQYMSMNTMPKLTSRVFGARRKDELRKGEKVDTRATKLLNTYLYTGDSHYDLDIRQREQWQAFLLIHSCYIDQRRRLEKWKEGIAVDVEPVEDDT